MEILLLHNLPGAGWRLYIYVVYRGTEYVRYIVHTYSHREHRETTHAFLCLSWLEGS